MSVRLEPGEPVIPGDVMDVADMGQDYQARLNRSSVGLVVAEARRQVGGTGTEICVDCLGDIPEDRREAQPGCTRCAECQALVERLGGGI